MTRQFVIHEEKGGLPYMLTWLSKDGRPCIEHLGTVDEARNRVFLSPNTRKTTKTLGGRN
jgi:hypothetical protein